MYYLLLLLFPFLDKYFFLAKNLRLRFLYLNQLKKMVSSIFKPSTKARRDENEHVLV